MRREVPHDHGRLRPSRGGKPILGILSTGSAALPPWLHSSAPLGPVGQRQIDATDRQIDEPVYELYGPTDDEIRFVEATTG